MMEVKYKTTANRQGVNEDFFCHKEMSQDCAIAVMCDGMGGLSLGGIASKVVAESIVDYVVKHHDLDETRGLIFDSLKYADEKLCLIGRQLHSNMGTAVAACYIQGQSLYYTWQGDVRIYIERDNSILQLTRDHVVDIGYGQTRLTRCIKGSGIRDDIPIGCYNLKDIDAIYMCTDGFYNKIEDLSYIRDLDMFDAIVDVDNEDDASLAIIKRSGSSVTP